MRRKSGITLIALVITIIVLLILAGVTISSITGDNGILTKASKAKEETRIRGLEEELELKYSTEGISIETGSTETYLEDVTDFGSGSDETGTFNLVEYKNEYFKVYYDGEEDNVTDVKYFALEVLEIHNCEEMIAFAERVNGGENFSNYIVKLKADLDFEGAEWECIGYAYLRSNGDKMGLSFSGIFDGENHSIKNFTIPEDRLESGLFGNNEGTIKNLNIEGFYINKTSSYLGYIGAVAAVNSGNIKNCSATVSISVKSEATQYHITVGAITGDNYGTIDGSIASGTVSAQGWYVDLGGIVGENTGTIKRCINNSTVQLNDGRDMNACKTCYSGGIVGINSGLVYQCKNNGLITGYVGGMAGIVGQNKSSSTIEECVNAGNLSTTFGSTTNPSYRPTLAGICASNSNSTIINSYNKGNIIMDSGKAGNLYGAIGGNSETKNCYSVGEVSGIGSTAYAFGNCSSAINCYYDSNTSVATDSYVTGISTSEFQSDSMITKLGDAYKKNPSGGYPLLNWE